jgi:uncharacterized protein
VTRAAIVETLAKDFSSDAETVRGVLEMLDAGLSATYVGRFRRGDSGLTEFVVRRLHRRREELQELDRRRGTILRMLAGPGAKVDEEIEFEGDGDFPEIRRCMDRFDLEDLFLPHRRPEPEVQLALDRGLGELADRIVAPSPNARPQAADDAGGDEDADGAEADEHGQGEAPDEHDEHEEHGEHAEHEEHAEHGERAEPADEAEREAQDPPAEHENGAEGDAAPEAEAPASGGKRPRRRRSKSTPAPPALTAEIPGLKEAVEVTPGLARLCREFVSPDRGVHTEEEALAGALRILSDRLGRDPMLRRAVRKALRKHAVLTVRASGDESRISRHKALLKTHEPIRQLQSKKLLRLRQAQKDRAVTTTLHLDPKHILPRVKKALGTRIDPEFQSVVDHVAAQALAHRLLPMIEADVRLELKERADEEALRFLAQHLRQVLLSPVGGHRPVAGISTNAKQDWILALVDADGNPTTGEIKIEAREKNEVQLAEELGNALRDTGVRALAVASGKGSLAQIARLRQCVTLLGADAHVFVVNEAGLGNYANSEHARKELPDHTVPARSAISIARRFQDLLLELLKVDPRHLGLGMESGLVSKANLKRTLDETVESAVAMVGCDVNQAPINLLRHLPGLDLETAKKIAARRDERPFASRDDLRESGVLSEAQWVSSVACLRVYGSPEPLDRTSLHPDQYAHAQRLIEAAGGNVEDVLGARGATKGLRRIDFQIDDTTWRDLVRELSFPGRDPRMRLFPPALLAADTDPATLAKGQVLEGIVTNVSSFGAFVDLGIARDGLIHVSEASNRYVRDAREVLTIGQVVRVRMLEAGGPRIMLSLKQVPAFEKRRPPQRSGGSSGGGGGSRRREREGEGDGPRPDWSQVTRNVRAAQSRRDGLAGAGKGRGEGGRGKGRRDSGGGSSGGGGGAGGGPRRGGNGPGRRDGRGGFPKDDYDADAVRKAGKTAVKYNPFAAFFDKGKDAESAEN